MERLAILFKRIAALLLLASLFLPLARCSYSTPSLDPAVSPEVLITHHIDTIPYQKVEASSQGVSILFAFTWPLLVQLGALLAPGRFRSRIAHALEFLLCLFTAVCIQSMMLFTTQVLYGFWIATAGLLLYVACLGLQFWQATFHKAARPRPPPHAPGSDA